MKWHLTNLEYLHFPRKYSLLLYLKALSKAVTSHYSSLIEENKNDARVTLQHWWTKESKSQCFVEQSIPFTLTSIEFTNFFTNNILTIREKITDHQIYNMFSYFQYYLYLFSLCLIDPTALTSVITSSKSSCVY